MIVKAQATGGAVTGLRVGAGNALRYFSREKSVIELQLDHLRIRCDLPPDFWDGTPEIRDRRLCAWLQVKRHALRSDSVPLSMLPKGEDLFQLKPAPPRRRPRTKTAAPKSR